MRFIQNAGLQAGCAGLRPTFKFFLQTAMFVVKVNEYENGNKKFGFLLQIAREHAGRLKEDVSAGRAALEWVVVGRRPVRIGCGNVAPAVNPGTLVPTWIPAPSELLCIEIFVRWGMQRTSCFLNRHK